MDIVNAYLKKVHPIPLLTAEQEVDLANQIRGGSREARDAMIRANLRLVVSIARKYSHLGIPLSDLIEEGNLGLMKSIEKFDPSRGFRFSTYAGWWIKQGISRSIIDQGRMIRIPVYLHEDMMRYNRAVQMLTHKLKRRPHVSEIAKKMKMKTEKVRSLAASMTKMSSLEMPIGENGDGQLKDVIEDKTASHADEQLDFVLAERQAMGYLSVLNDRERRILEMRYGLNGDDQLTLVEIAGILGISRERVRQIEEAAIRKIRKMVEKEDVKRRD